MPQSGLSLGIGQIIGKFRGQTGETMRLDTLTRQSDAGGVSFVIFVNGEAHLRAFAPSTKIPLATDAEDLFCVFGRGAGYGAASKNTFSSGRLPELKSLKCDFNRNSELYAQGVAGILLHHIRLPHLVP